jgi:DNA-binding NarL/FixJ family response regulator
MLSSGMQSKEVAAELHIPPGTVGSRLNYFGRRTGLYGAKMATTGLIMAGYLEIESQVQQPDDIAVAG